MNLFTETALISMGMLAASALPLFSKTLRQFSKFFYLLGTGALAGILLFDLVPDLFQMGGSRSILSAGFVWVIYSFIHVYHMNFHKKEVEEGEHCESETTSHLPHTHAHEASSFFLVAMIAHCLASGMLLVTSEEYSQGLNRSIFVALLAHKLYESITVSSVLMGSGESFRKSFYSILLYSLSLPVGVGVTYLFRGYLTPNLALLITSLASGTLLGCLVFDFMIPSYHMVRAKFVTVLWILAGLASAQLIVKAL